MNLDETRIAFLDWKEEGKLQNDSKATYNRKLTVFFEYLSEEYNISIYTKFEEAVRHFDIKTVVNSINYYVYKYDISGVTTVECYKSALNSYFGFLNKEIMQNKFYDSKLTEDKMFNAIGERIKELNLKNKDTYYPVTRDTFYRLSELCDAYINDFELSDEILETITETTEVRGQIDDFEKFISSIATKLVMLAGLKNDTVKKLNITDLDLDANTIKINRYNIYLPIKLNRALEKYKIIREKILKKNNNNTEIALFVTRKGQRVKTKENSYIFKVVAEILENLQVKTVAKYTIINLLKINTNSSQIQGLTGYKAPTIEHCSEILLNNSNPASISIQLRNLKEFEII